MAIRCENIDLSGLYATSEQYRLVDTNLNSDDLASEYTLNQLKQVMLLSGQDGSGSSIYGKTGMDKAHGIVVDSWFTGFADSDGKRIYFCVYLGETEGKDVSSAKAREIAVEIVSDYLN